ncbi:MAG: ATP-binding protein [Prevotellaceae bacterium]|jgi:AAA+ ATPase superfamily predicted ATPase|nr:ATP-binding protein [Prevotellaceae bacterium]
MAVDVENPFLVVTYHSPAYFCDRKEETKKVANALINGRNLTLLSARRIGKTGLIRNVFYQLQKKKGWQTLYVDIMPTSNLNDFIKLLGKAVVEHEWRRSKNYLKKIAILLSGISAKLSFDPITGAPEIGVEYQTRQESEKSLSEIFHYLSTQDTKYAIAFDEFQQIICYPEKNVEALLRSHIQQLTNVNFVFSGSNKHLLTSMFSDYARPFYQSSDFLFLEKIEANAYCRFIREKFAKYGKSIAAELVEEALEYYRIHTFYVQYFFNKLFENSEKTVTKAMMEQVHRLILEEREHIYYSYRNLLTPYQFSLLKAIAREGGVNQPNASDFIAKHDLKQGSSVNRALAALVEKEMVYEENGVYHVYDVFFSKWLAKIF